MDIFGDFVKTTSFIICLKKRRHCNRQGFKWLKLKKDFSRKYSTWHFRLVLPIFFFFLENSKKVFDIRDWYASISLTMIVQKMKTRQYLQISILTLNPEPWTTFWSLNTWTELRYLYTDKLNVHFYLLCSRCPTEVFCFMCCDIQAFPSSIIKLLKLFKTSSFGALFTFTAFTSEQYFVALVITNNHI